ncbi:RDD family protein [Microbulbifer halophilus]|uniref:RDD family protein n=1 Tax=Microbulbifer halophilus TaxID=453963 RepID=A0ABW5EDX2_9GAMM|nr:RDD family protein [Microbulbifer halophilus]MCW8125294.1 RDD family protein [Microbulbifer halophilus]
MSQSRPPSTAPTFDELPPAGVGRRLAALVYDSLILVGLLMVYGFVAMLLASAVVGLNCQPEELDYNPCVSGPLFQLGAVAVIAGYFIWSWRAAGQTIGMRAWRLLLASPGGVQLSWRQCALRALAAPISLACLGAGYFWAWTRADRASWHDLASGAGVRLLPKKKK